MASIPTIPTRGLASNNPFRRSANGSMEAGDGFAPNDIVSDLNEPNDVQRQQREETSEGDSDPDQRQDRTTRPPFMSERHRSSSAPNVNALATGGSRPFRLARKPPPPPPRPIFPPTKTANDESYRGPERETRDKEKRTSRTDLESQEKLLLQRAIEESKRDSYNRPRTKNSDEDEQLRRAIEASRLDTRPSRTPTMSSQESAELEQALALSSAEQEYRLPRASNTPSPTKPRQPSSSQKSTPTKPGRSRSVSNPEALPPFPFTEQDLVRPSYPSEKSRLFPQGLPSLPPGAGTTQDEYSREMEMLTLAIRLSEEEERLRKEREERELREVVRRVEEKENAVLGSSSRPSVPGRRNSPLSDEATTSVSPTSSPKQPRRSSWFRPPLASKYSTSASPPASPPLSPESIDRPGLEATPTDSTTRSGATSFRSAVESLPFSNLVPTSSASTNDHSSRSEPRPLQRRPAAPPHPTRLPPSPPETPIVSTTSFSPVAPPIPPLPASYSRSRKNTIESERSSGPFLPAQSDAFRHENDGSPIEMPYLTPSASNSIRSERGGAGGGGRINSWALEERNGSGGSGSGGSRSESTSGHSRGNSFNRRSTEVVAPGGGNSGTSSRNRSEEGHGEVQEQMRRSFEEGDDGDPRRPSGDGDSSTGSIESVRLAIRNPDSASPRPPIEIVRHQGGFVSEPPSVDVPRDVEVGDPYLENLDGGGPIFESAYAGRSMSAIDEQTEPASSIIAEEGGTDYSRQGSYPSTHGSLDPTIHQVEEEGRVLEDEGEEYERSVGGQDMRQSITYHPRPIEEREWMHESAMRRPSLPPPPLAHSSSLTPTPPRRESPPELNLPQESEPSHARQMTASSAVTNSSAGPRLSFPLPPFMSTLSPMTASPVESNLTSTSVPTTRSHNPEEPTPTQHAAVAFADGTRFGHPSICAREPGHVCPDDGLDGAEREAPETIELTALMDDHREPSIGLGLSRHSTRRREETGGKSILRDAWAVEARSWGSLLRFLMWYGETKLVASPRDIALEPTRHCTAAASLEFRPDDEGYTIIRLVVTILPPDDPESHSHRELTVEHPVTTPPASNNSKGKGKARSYFQHSSPSSSAPSSDPNATLAAFHLPDSVHLPCRLSNLAIQLYTLRHLASIARSTQPAKEGGTASYQALRELSTALEGLTAIAQSRQDRDTSSSQGPSHYRYQSGGGVAPTRGGGGDDNERLLTRLRDRLRRLKRGGGGGNENAPYTSPTKPNKLVKAPPVRRDTNSNYPKENISLPQTVQPLSRAERVLSANDHGEEDEEDQEHEAEVLRNGSGSGNHLEVDGARWSIVRREQPDMRRAAIPQEWDTRRNGNLANETQYMPVLRS
ncbi:hypothetical protein JCM16303_000368 [Sporobolomyces ruberrimus]